MKKISYYYYQFLFNKKALKQLIWLPILVLVGMGSWLYGYKFRDSRIVNLNNEVASLNYTIDTLVASNDTLNAQLVDYNKLKEDGDYYRYMAFKHSEITIPKTMNVDDLKLLHVQALRYNIPLKYVYRLVYKESRYNPNAQSNKGASGYMQVMPRTFNAIKKRYENKNGTIDHLDRNKQNILVGTFYLDYLYKKYGRWDLTFAAYNCGPKPIQDAGGRVPNIPETKYYVNFIMNI